MTFALNINIFFMILYVSHRTKTLQSNFEANLGEVLVYQRGSVSKSFTFVVSYDF